MLSLLTLLFSLGLWSSSVFAGEPPSCSDLLTLKVPLAQKIAQRDHETVHKDDLPAKAAKIASSLGGNGVNFKIIKNKTGPAYFLISDKGDSYLNRLSAKLSQNLGVKLNVVWNGIEDRNTIAQFESDQNVIKLGPKCFLEDDDFSNQVKIFHEIRHAYVFHLMKEGSDVFFYGYIRGLHGHPFSKFGRGRNPYAYGTHFDETIGIDEEVSYLTSRFTVSRSTTERASILKALKTSVDLERMISGSLADSLGKVLSKIQSNEATVSFSKVGRHGQIFSNNLPGVVWAHVSFADIEMEVPLFNTEGTPEEQLKTTLIARLERLEYTYKNLSQQYEVFFSLVKAPYLKISPEQEVKIASLQRSLHAQVSASVIPSSGERR
jgi:hypothetical protein